MPLDLTAARALHDRDPNNPEACPTCASDTDPHQMARWPCATALALGATGRSEWKEAPAPDPDTMRRVHIATAGWYHIATGAELIGPAGTTTKITFDTETNRCRSIAPGGLPCMGDAGHDSRHWNTETANRWLDPGQIACDGNNPGGWHCNLTIGHTGPHRDQNGGTW